MQFPDHLVTTLNQIMSEHKIMTVELLHEISALTKAGSTKSNLL